TRAARFRIHGVHQLSHRVGDARQRPVWPGPDTPDEPRHHCRGRGAQHASDVAPVDQESGCHQAGIEDARYGTERSRRRSRGHVSRASAVMSTNTIAVSEFPPAARPLTLRLHDWVTTVDHKRLGMLYVLYALVFLIVGGIEATIMRLQLIRPHNDLVSPQ